jgi:hypothetical protein
MACAALATIASSYLLCLGRKKKRGEVDVGDDARVKGLTAIVPLSCALQVDIYVHTHVRGWDLQGIGSCVGARLPSSCKDDMFCTGKYFFRRECGKDRRRCALRPDSAPLAYHSGSMFPKGMYNASP